MSNTSQTLFQEIVQLEAHAQNELIGRIRNLRLVVRQNGLILRGQAHTFCAKQLAQHAVMKLTWFPIQANEIEVS